MSFIQLKPQYGLNYKAGQIFFTYKINSPISAGITFYSRSEFGINKRQHKWSHCGICIGEGMGVHCQYPRGVTEAHLEDYFMDPKTRISFREVKDISEFQIQALIGAAKEFIGRKPYDIKLIMGLWLTNTMVFRRFPSFKKVLKYFDSDDKFICSEFVLYCLKECGFCLDIESNIITPEGVFDLEIWKDWKRNPVDLKGFDIIHPKFYSY